MPLPLPSLLDAAASITRRVAAVPLLETHDGSHWKCTARDMETGGHADALPTTCSDSPHCAVQLFLDALHAEGLDKSTDDRRALVRTLAEAFPEGVTFAAAEVDALVATLAPAPVSITRKPARAAGGRR